MKKITITSVIILTVISSVFLYIQLKKQLSSKYSNGLFNYRKGL